jgi:MFS family permease
MKTLRKTRLYYGWIIVAIGFFTMMLTMGSVFSSGVLFAAIVAEYGWSRATASLPFSIALVVYAGTAWLAGRLFDRYGPRRLFPLGAICLGLGLMLSAQIQSPWHLCLSWGVLVAQGFNLAGFAPHLAHVARWFTRQRGLATGLVLSGASVGGLVIVPSAQYLVNHYGWRLAYSILGALVMLCLIPLNALGQRQRPAEGEWHPDGVTAQPITLSFPPRLAEMGPWTLWRAMRTMPFWLIFLLGLCLGWLSNITNVHQIAHITSVDYPSMLAAAIVGLVSLLRAVSSALGGGLSDRFGRRVVFTMGTVLCTGGLLCLVLLQPATPIWLLYGYALTFGLGYGVYGSVYASVTADLFFGPHLGTILGALEMGWGLGGFAGGWVGGVWHDRWSSYHGAFALAIGVNLLGWIALWLAAPRRVPPRGRRRPAAGGRRPSERV